MNRLTWTAILAAGVFVVPASAQGPYVRPQVNPYYRPPVSPYLNLAIGGSPGINYYGIVRPQLQTNAALQQLQQAQMQEAAELTQAYTQGVPITGVRAQYMNFSHYYGGRVTNSATLPPATIPPAYTPRAVVPLYGNQVVNQGPLNPMR